MDIQLHHTVDPDGTIHLRAHTYHMGKRLTSNTIIEGERLRAIPEDRRQFVVNEERTSLCHMLINEYYKG